MANILVVDDQLVMRNMFKTILRPLGDHIVLEADGMLAYARAKALQFDIILTDLYMPKLDGIQLTTELRKLPNYARTPIFVVSTESATDKKKDGKAAGATGWIVKPITSDKLLPVIKNYLS
ncbi:MAG: response regulator [Gammaproteobacteria bacterium]|nr:MAG: response regulator [Gammaproteobacteria bacterium]